MSAGQNGEKIPWIFILLLGFAIILFLYLGPDLSSRLTGRTSATWDPFSPILNGLAGIGQSLQDQFRNILR